MVRWSETKRRTFLYKEEQRSPAEAAEQWKDQVVTASPTQHPPLLVSGHHDTQQGQKNKGRDEDWTVEVYSRAEREKTVLLLCEDQHHWCEQTGFVIFWSCFLNDLIHHWHISSFLQDSQEAFNLSWTVWLEQRFNRSLKRPPSGWLQYSSDLLCRLAAGVLNKAVEPSVLETSCVCVVEKIQQIIRDHWPFGAPGL